MTARAARIPLLPREPASSTLYESERLIRTAGICLQNLNEGCGDLLCCPALAIPLEPMPVAFNNAELLMQGSGQVEGLWGQSVHATGGVASIVA